MEQRDIMESAQKKFWLKKITAVAVVITFVILMFGDLTAAIDTAGFSMEALICICRGLLYGAGAVMLAMECFRPKNMKRYYAAYIVMILIIVFDVVIERRFTVSYVLAAMGFILVMLSEEKWNKLLVKIMAVLLITLCALSVFGGAWHVKNNIDFLMQERAHEGAKSRIKMATDKGFIEVNGAGAARWSPAFKYEKVETTIIQTPFDYNEKGEKVVQWGNLNLINADHKSVILTQDVKDILKASLIFDEKVIKIYIYKVKDEYYVEPAKGLMHWNPHVYYEFDKTTKKLKKIVSLDEETVVGFKKVK